MLDEWLNALSHPPRESGRYKVRLDGVGLRYADYDQQRKSWDIDGTVISWKKLAEERDIDALPHFDEEALSVIDLGELDAEMLALVALSRKEMVRTIDQVDIEITVASVREDADTFLSGRVLAVSEHYASQQVSDTSLVIHENARLSQLAIPGQEVTVRYQDGLGEVMEDLSARYVIKVRSPELLDDEIRKVEAIMRTIMLDVASRRLDDVGLDRLLENLPENVILGMAHKAMKLAARQLGWETTPEKVSVTRTQLKEVQDEQIGRILQRHTEVSQLKIPKSPRI